MGLFDSVKGIMVMPGSIRASLRQTARSSKTRIWFLSGKKYAFPST